MITALATLGYRITNQRRSIADAITDSPLSAADIFEKLRKTQSPPDLATVYRTLELFTQTGYLHRTQFDEKNALYERASGNIHHHHIVCTACKKICDIALPEKKLIDQVEEHTKWKVTRHALEFFGLCTTCTKGNK